nr:MAG TPA_asm: hypothetical protein [Caudoviricetes sp.]
MNSLQAVFSFYKKNNGSYLDKSLFRVTLRVTFRVTLLEVEKTKSFI